MHPLSTSYLSDASVAVICAAAAGVALLAFALLSLRLSIARKRVPVRIMILGTRGKSTLVRLIAAGLRSKGLNVIARVSGTQPKWIDELGAEHIWRRRGSASIRELEGVMRLAAARSADAIVVESMAISSRLTADSIQQIIRPDTVVITNTRTDHLEERQIEQETEAGRLAAMLPVRGGSLVISDEIDSPLIRQLAASNDNEVLVVTISELEPLEGMRSLATAVCGPSAASAIKQLTLQDGAFSSRSLRSGNNSFNFFDAFSCNDPESLAHLLRANPHHAVDVILLNARPDRPLRTKAMLEFLRHSALNARLFISGDALAVRYARKMGFSDALLLPQRDPQRILDRLAEATPPDGTAWGIGNYQGVGGAISRLLKAMPC